MEHALKLLPTAKSGAMEEEDLIRVKQEQYGVKSENGGINVKVESGAKVNGGRDSYNEANFDFSNSNDKQK